MPLVNPAGPTFISYRWADGADAARDAARRLRASGVPVWLDRDDLPPGELASRLKEALVSGVAGALLVVTPKLAPRRTPTDFILDLEVPTILDTLVPAGAVVAVLNTVTDNAGHLNRGAPGTLYRRAEASSFTQFSSVDGTLEDMGRTLARERLRQLRSRRGCDELVVDLQTRRASTGFASDGDLVFRTVPPTDSRTPARVVWEDLAAFTSWLPDVVAEQRAPEVLLTGGAHLSVAFAVGTALPATTGTPIAVRTAEGETWRVAAHAQRWGWRRLLRPVSLRCLRWRGEGDALAVLVDLVPTPADRTFTAHLEANHRSYRSGAIIKANRTWDGSSGPRVVADVARRIRGLAARHDQQVHLFLRTPWAAAALLGAHLNTLRVTLYEWDNTRSNPLYVKTISVVPGLRNPVTDIFVPASA